MDDALIVVMSSFLIDISLAANRFQNLAASILDVHRKLIDVMSNEESPEHIIEGIDQFLRIATQLDMSRDTADAVDDKDVTQLGNYGLSLLMDLQQWVSQRELHELASDIQLITLSIADWIIRHAGQIQILEPVVDALAKIANQSSQHAKLITLTQFMGKIQHACANISRSDLEKSNPGRPWRILCLNRCIAATRSHDPKQMEQAFAFMIQVMPDEAPRFFSEGMQEMDKLDYPAHVKKILQDYFDKYTRPTMN